jgi:hypothetical protein
MADLFTAVDTAGLATKVTAILVAFIGVNLLFVANRYIKKSGVR